MSFPVKRIKELATTSYGYTERAVFEPVGPRFLRITDIQDSGVEWRNVPYCQISQQECSKYQLKSGDLVFARTGATTGKSYLLTDPPDAVFASYLIRLRLNNTNLDPRFLWYFFQTESYWSEIRSGSTGSAQGGFNASKVGELQVPVPPLPEQQRIVAILDEAFAAIDTAKTNTQKNLQNAEELLQARVYEIIENGKMRWGAEKHLIDVCELFFDSAHRTPKYSDDGIPALRPRDIVGGELRLSSALRVSEEEYIIQAKRYAPRPGDIVYSRELSLGWSVVIPNDIRLCLSQGMCVFRPVRGLEAEYLTAILNSSYGRSQSISAAVGAAHPHVNLGDIKAFRIPVPSPEERSAILDSIKELQSETQRLTTLYQRKLDALDELKQSLLHHAFTGQL